MVDGRVTLGHDGSGGGPPWFGGRGSRTRAGAARFGNAHGMSGQGVNEVTKETGGAGGLWLRVAAISHGKRGILVCGRGEDGQWNT